MRIAIFRGNVQGVGFRRRTYGIAQSFPVVGYVKNLADGSVELAAQAESVVLDSFFAAVAQEMEQEIESIEFFEESDRNFKTFEIVRS